MKDIKTLANDLQVSKETIYKKLNGTLQNELQQHKFKKNGKVYIDDVGEILILQSLRRENEEITDVCSETQKPPKESDIVNNNVITKDIQNLELINVLKAQIEEKDKQIVTNFEHYKEQLQNKDNQIKELSNKNNELDTHLQELNNKLINIITGEQQIKIGTIIKDTTNRDIAELKTENEQPGTTDQQQVTSSNPKKNIIQRLFNL